MTAATASGVPTFASGPAASGGASTFASPAGGGRSLALQRLIETTTATYKQSEYSNYQHDTYSFYFHCVTSYAGNSATP